MCKQTAAVLRSGAGAALLAALFIIMAALPAHGQIDLEPTLGEIERTATAIIEMATAQAGTPGLLFDLTPTPAFIDPNVEPMAATATTLIEEATATAAVALAATAEAQAPAATGGTDGPLILIALALMAAAALFSAGYILGRRSRDDKPKRSG